MHDGRLAVPTISSEAASRPSTTLDRWLLRRIQGLLSTAPLRYELWDGFVLSPQRTVAGTVRFRNRRALFGCIFDAELNFGEAYMSGAIEIDGELVAVLEVIYRAFPSAKRRPWWLWQRSNDVDAARENVHHHYDLGNSFYKLWLDREMVYTCAYFPDRTATLEEAQLAKMRLVCRKLGLQPGERVIEAGFGWGSLALFMAKEFGVKVRAFNVSSEQVQYAREAAARAGLTDRIEFIDGDYRDAGGECDAFVSIGMLEHVGLPDYRSLGEVIGRTLAPNGRGLLHFIGRNQPAPLNPWIRNRIFPGAYPPTLREVFEHVLEPQALSVLDVENLRLHYVETLKAWLHRFENASSQVADMFDETFVRAWRLYLAGSQVGFATGSMQLFQVLFARGDSNAIPWTRVAGL